MTTPTTAQTDTASATDLATEIRQTLDRLEELDAKKGGYLKTLAFILYRVAAADQDVSDDEIQQMESILVNNAGVSQTEAVLTVEIARHCREICDCARSYDVSRRLRPMLDSESRRHLQEFLRSVAEADGLISISELAQIRQISAELRLETA